MGGCVGRYIEPGMAPVADTVGALIMLMVYTLTFG